MPKLDYKDTAVRAAKFVGPVREGKGGQTEYRIVGHPGLILMVQAPNDNGISTKVWRFHYSLILDGKQVKRKIRLGAYPEPMTLADAANKAAELRAAVDAGRDPAKELVFAKAIAQQQALTFKDLISECLEAKRAMGVRSVDEVERAFRRDVYDSALAGKPPSQITDVDIENLLDAVAGRRAQRIADRPHGKAKIEANSGSSMARHLLVYLRGVFNYALISSPKLREKYGLVVNPAATVGRSLARGKPGKYGKQKPKQRYLDDTEVVAFWRALEVSEVEDNTKLLLKLLLLTGQRTIEIRMATPSQLKKGDDGKPVLLLEGTKNEQPLVVPLPPLACQLFEEARKASGNSTWLFPGDTEEGCIGDGTARQAVQRLFETNRPERLVMPRFTPHDLRRTVKTQMAKLGIPKEVRDAVQNHKPTGIGDQVYNVWNYLPEKRDALERLEAHILGLLKKV